MKVRKNVANERRAERLGNQSEKGSSLESTNRLILQGESLKKLRQEGDKVNPRKERHWKYSFCYLPKAST